MKPHYDIVFITPESSFYKIKLFNEIAKKMRVCTIYNDMEDAARSYRTKDFLEGEQNFFNLEVYGGVISKTKKILRFLHSIDYTRLVLPGWNEMSTLLVAILSTKKKNACIVESSIYESRTKGIRAFIKRRFLNRITIIYVPGKSNERLVRALGYKGQCIKTGGCGLLNYLPQPEFEPRNEVNNFLYVGRLVEVKNVALLISVFNELPDLHLVIVGTGPLETQLKLIANNNISFLGHIRNERLFQIYRQADSFILPSKSEPWGLVVEEALNNGTPVIVSDKVGCSDDLVTEDTGLTFHSGDKDDLKSKVLKMCDVSFYNNLRKKISFMDFQTRAISQVNSYLTTFSSQD